MAYTLQIEDLTHEHRILKISGDFGSGLGFQLEKNEIAFLINYIRGFRYIGLDLQGVNYIDEIGFGALIALLKKAQANQQILYVRPGIPPRIMKKLNITGLIKVFKFATDQEVNPRLTQTHPAC